MGDATRDSDHGVGVAFATLPAVITHVRVARQGRAMGGMGAPSAKVSCSAWSLTQKTTEMLPG